MGKFFEMRFGQDETQERNTRATILRAGHDAITEKSYHGVGLKEILDRAGVPKGSFYHNFKSKEDFAAQLVDVSTDDFVQYLRASLTDKGKEPVDRILNFFSEKREYYIANNLVCDCAIAKIAMELCSHSEMVRGAIKYSYDACTAVLAQCIREAQAAGEIGSKKDADMLANLIFCGFQGVNIRVQINKDIQCFDDYVDMVLYTILDIQTTSAK